MFEREYVELLGRTGFQRLYALMTGMRPPRLTRLPVELIERQSVAPPPRRN